MRPINLQYQNQIAVGFYCTSLFVFKEKLAKKGDINFGQIRMKSPQCTFAKKSFEGCSGKWSILGNNNEMLTIACGKLSNHW